MVLGEPNPNLLPRFVTSEVKSLPSSFLRLVVIEYDYDVNEKSSQDYLLFNVIIVIPAICNRSLKTDQH